MKRCHHRSFRPFLVVIPMLLVATIVLGACGRGHWHSGHDPERMEKKMAGIEEDIGEDLEIRPEQQESYHAVAERYKSLARNWMATWSATKPNLATALAEESYNPDQVALHFKELLAARPSNEQLEALIDETLVFVKTLNPEQQEELRQKFADKFDH